MDDTNSPLRMGEAAAIGNAVASFIPDALRTLSPGFSGSKVPVIAIINAVSHFRQAAERMDLIKKVLFYDRADAYAKLVQIMPILGVDPTAPEVLCMTHDISNYDRDMLHAVLGACTEAGELAEALERFMVGDTSTLDETNVKEEFGDIFWYAAIAFDRMGTTFPAEMDRVIRKLRARFPDKFTEEAANSRDLSTERAVLETDASSFNGGGSSVERIVVGKLGTDYKHFGQADLQSLTDAGQVQLVTAVRAMAAYCARTGAPMTFDYVGDAEQLRRDMRDEKAD